MNPVASVIMPCYNSEAHLAPALESVLSQTFADFELVVVDDGSSDSTGHMLAETAARDERVRVFTQPVNRGVSAARNRGLDEARGEYVFFVDPDDAAHPEMLARGIAEMDRAKADFCIFAYRRRFGDDGEWTIMPLQGDYRLVGNEAIVREFLPRIFGYSNKQARVWGRRGDWRAGREEGSVCRCVYRLDVIRRANVRFNENIVLYEDAMFNAEYLLSAERTTAIAEPLYDYTVRPQGAVTRNNRTRALFTNKLRLLENRRRLDEIRNGRLFEFYSASCVFSVLEMLHALHTTNESFREGWRAIHAYLRDERVREAFRAFPLPPLRPFAAIAILMMRLYASAMKR